MSRWPRLALVGTGLLGLVLVAVAVLSLNRQPAPPPRPVGILPIVTPAFPSAAPVPSIGYRVVSADLNIDLPIVAGDGWTVPFYKAASYPGMALPGQNGRSFIYAHAQAGMFAPLAHATVGQHVDIVKPDGTRIHYVIKLFYARWPPGDTRYLKPADHEELILLTCTSYQPNDPRILAVAQPI